MEYVIRRKGKCCIPLKKVACLAKYRRNILPEQRQQETARQQKENGGRN